MLSESMILPGTLFRSYHLGEQPNARYFVHDGNDCCGGEIYSLGFPSAILPVAGRETRVVSFGTIRDGVDCVFSLGH